MIARVAPCDVQPAIIHPGLASLLGDGNARLISLSIRMIRTLGLKFITIPGFNHSDIGIGLRDAGPHKGAGPHARPRFISEILFA